MKPLKTPFCFSEGFFLRSPVCHPTPSPPAPPPDIDRWPGEKAGCWTGTVGVSARASMTVAHEGAKPYSDPCVCAPNRQMLYGRSSCRVNSTQCPCFPLTLSTCPGTSLLPSHTSTLHIRCFSLCILTLAFLFILSGRLVCPKLLLPTRRIILLLFPPLFHFDIVIFCMSNFGIASIT